MANLTKFLGGLLAPKVVSDILSNQEPKDLATDCAKILKKAVTVQIGDKAYRTIFTDLISWLDAFYVAFRKALNEG